MKEILKRIAEQENLFKKGLPTVYEIETERTTKAGTTIRHKATRNTDIGFSYSVYSVKISIKKGVQERYEGRTDGFGYYGGTRFIKSII